MFLLKSFSHRAQSQSARRCTDVKAKQNITIRTAALDADNVAATTKFLQAEQPELLINVALPYQDLTLMDACLTRVFTT